MHHKLHYLGWSRSLADAVSSFLLDDRHDAPFSFADTILVVPTAQAGRRLRLSLAKKASARGSGVLAGPVVTPFRLLQDPNETRVLSRFAETAFWIAALSPVHCRRYQSLFPRLPASLDFEWREKTAALLIQLREQLAEAGLSVADVADSELIHEAEKRRWSDITELVGVYTASVRDAGYVDSIDHQLAAAAKAQPPAGIKRVVVAACPELALILRNLLERWSEQIRVDVLVHAPETMGDVFDAWGCPVVDAWKNRVEIDFESGGAEFLVAANEKEQAESVRRIFEAHSEWVEKGDISVGVPDGSIVPFLVQTLSRMGCPAYDPNGTSNRAHPIYQWIKAWRDLVSLHRYESLRNFARHPDVLAYAERSCGLRSTDMLQELDALQNECFPVTVDDVRAYLKDRQKQFPQLVLFMQLVSELMSKGGENGPHLIRELLAEMYGDRLLKPGLTDDDAFIGVARHLVDTLEEHRDVMNVFPDMRVSEWLDLLLKHAEQASYYLDEQKHAVELEGWLELPWNDAALMVVTGMNDSIVPGGVFEDLFLPDSVREALGVRSDASLTARDAYILYSLNEARRQSGKLTLIAGRQSESGDVLKPSRLFWRCANEELVRRAKAFFQSTEALRQVPERHFHLGLNASPPDERAAKRLAGKRWAVTHLHNFLDCPFRFYLSNILEMEPVRDDAEELDALAFGTLVHHVLEVFGSDRKLWSMKNPDILGGSFEGMIHDAIRARFGRNPPMMVTIQAASAIQRLKAYARVHVEDFRQGWEVIDVERKFILNILDNEVVGKIDRIDRHPDGRLRVLDYKTYNAYTEPPKSHLRAPREIDKRSYVSVEVPKRNKKETKFITRHWADLQLPLYLKHMFEAEGADARVEAGYALLTKAAMDVSIAMWEGLDTALVESAFACAEGIVGDIAAGKFGPPLIESARDDFDELLWPDFLNDVSTDTIGAPHA